MRSKMSLFFRSQRTGAVVWAHECVDRRCVELFEVLERDRDKSVEMTRWGEGAVWNEVEVRRGRVPKRRVALRDGEEQAVTAVTAVTAVWEGRGGNGNDTGLYTCTCTYTYTYTYTYSTHARTCLGKGCVSTG